MKEYRVAIKFPWVEYWYWYFTCKEKAESFDLDRFVMNDGMFDDFDPFRPETNVIFVLYEYDESHHYGRPIKKTDFLTVWAKWMESVKDVF